MKKLVITLGALTLLVGNLIPSQVTAEETLRRLFFLHHSTGRNLIQEGDVRTHLDNINADRGANFSFWDHDYNYIGLSDHEGDLLSYHYAIPGDNTDPDGLHILWTTNNASRDSIMARYDIIAFKSCYPASDIDSDAKLEQYKTWYLEIRDFFDQHPEKVFVVMSPPPRHRLATNTDNADRARLFSQWLGTDEYLAGHSNVVYFDFFNHLAQADDGSSTRNMLQYDFERSHYTSDSHPNAVANQFVAPLFINFMVESATTEVSASGIQSPALFLKQNYPNPFNPKTHFSFSLEASSHAKLEIFDVRGRKILTLGNDIYSAGQHNLTWDGTNDQGSSVGSGTYFFRLKTKQGSLSRKMTLVK